MLKTLVLQRRPLHNLLRVGVFLVVLFSVMGVVWLQTRAAVTAVILINSPADTTTAGDGACTLREAIANINNASETTSGDCATGSGNVVIEFAPSLHGQTITLAGTELSISANATINGPGAQLLSVSGNNASRVFNIASGMVEIRGLTIANGRITDDDGGGINNAGTLILSHSVIAQSAIASGGVTNGGGIHNSGAMTITHSAILSNTNSGTTARGGGIASTAGQLTVQNSTISGNSSDIWGGGVHNTGSSTLFIDHSTIARNTAVTFWGGGLVVENNTTATIKNSILAGNVDTTGPRDCYYFGQAPTSQGYNLVENRGNCTFNATGDATGQNARLGALGANGGPAADGAGQPIDPSGQATWTIPLLADSPAIDQIANGVNGCALGQTTDQRSYYRADACDIGAYEYDGLQVTLAKAVDDANPGPGDIITYTLTVAVADSGDIALNDAVITDAMPSGINFVGPVTVDGGSGALTAVPPTIVSNLVISDGTAVTVTFPVSISIGLTGGTVITNTAYVDSPHIGAAAMNWQALTVRNVAPVAVADGPVVLEDSGTTSFAVKTNDYDLNWDAMTLTAVGSTSHSGTAAINSGQIDYTPGLHFNGTEVFTYTISDGTLTGTTAVTVTITPVNDAPVISGNETVTATMSEDGDSLSFGFDASDVENDTLSWTIQPGIGEPANGLAVISATSGSGNIHADVAYTPTLDFTGSDAFTVQVSDGELTDTVAVEVTIEPLNDPPQPADDFFMIVPGESGLTMTFNLLGNDVEVDGETLSLFALGAPSLTGTAHISGSVAVYTPTLALGETEIFTYTVSDGSLMETAVVSVTAVAGAASGSNGETVNIPTIGGAGSITLTMQIPTHADNGNESLTVVFTETAVITDSPAGLDFAGLNFNLDAYVNGAATSPYTLTAPITLTIAYDDDDIASRIRTEDSLELRYWNGSAWASDGITLVERDTVNNRLVITLQHLTEFTLLGLPKYYVYLPMTVNN